MLSEAMSRAQTHSEWQALATRYDMLSGGQRWRTAPQSKLYDYAELGARYEHLRRCLEHGETHELLYALNEGIHGNMGGMGRPVLYNRARSGTKHLIDNYVATIAEALEFIARSSDHDVPRAEKVDFFRRASHCYGRSALLLSGGGGLMYAHHGVVQELLDHNLLPRVISGASSGALIAAQLGTRTDDELIADYFVNKRYLEVERTRLRGVVAGRLPSDEVRRSRERMLDEIVPRDLTFQDAFEMTGRFINISISPAERHQESRLLNAITSPNVYVRAAVAASSSIPGVLPSERLYARGVDGKSRLYLASRRWIDGSASGDLPAKRLSRLYGVNHFIVSMINPVVTPFVTDAKLRPRHGVGLTLRNGGLQVAREVVMAVEHRLRDRGPASEFVATQLSHVASLVGQDYLGNINVILGMRDFKWRQVLFEFRPGEIESMIEAGRRNTWPKLAMIRNAALVSETLDRILEQLDHEGSEPRTRARHRLAV